MELDELEVADGRPGPQRGRDAVTGRHARVGRRRVDLADAAGREHHGPGPHRADAVALPLPHHVQGEPGDGAVRGPQQVEDERVLDDLDVGGVEDAGDQRTLDLGTRGVAAGVRDAVAVVAALAGQRQLTVVGPVEAGAHLGQLAHRGRPLADERADGRLVAYTGAGHHRVGEVLLGRVTGAERGRDAALRPPGRAGGEDVLGHEQHAQRRLAADVQRGREPGDARPHDDDVGLDVPAGFGGGQPPGQPHSWRPTLSMSRVVPTRAATSNRAAPCTGAAPRSAPRSCR